MSFYLWPVVTWDERQTHRECVRRMSNRSRTFIQHSYGDYRRAVEKVGEGPFNWDEMTMSQKKYWRRQGGKVRLRSWVL